MAKPTTTSFGDFTVEIGDNNSPSSFFAPCGFVSKALDINGQDSETITPDCDDPDAASWTEAAITALSATIQGNGVLAEESYGTWAEWMASAVARYVRVTVGDRGYWEGQAIMTRLGHAVALGQDGSKVQCAVNLRNAGAWTWNTSSP